VVGERLDVDEIVMRAVLLQPFAHILLGPEHHRLGQAAQRGAGVVDAIVVAGPALRGAGGEEVSRIQPLEEENASAGSSAHRDGGEAGRWHSGLWLCTLEQEQLSLSLLLSLLQP